MGMGTRKIQMSEIGNSTKSQAAVTHNSGAFSGLNNDLSDFIGESALQGKGWASAKTLAEVYKTITQTFSMVSEQLANANQKVVSSQGILLNNQIDEQALKTQIMQNKANMTQLSYANSIWNSANPGKTNQNSYNNLQQSIKNENAELEKELGSLNEFDLTTKYVYDDLEHTLSNLPRLIAQVSNASNTYDSKTGLFSTKGIDMKLVAKYQTITTHQKEIKALQKKWNLSDKQAEDLYLFMEESKKYPAHKTGAEVIWNFIKNEFSKLNHNTHVSPDDKISIFTLTYVDPGSKVQHGITIVINETTGEIVYEKGWGTEGEFEASLSKYGGTTSQNVIRKFGNKNPDIKELQDESKMQTRIGNGISQLANAIVRAKGINDSTKTVSNTISGKDYIEQLKRAEETMKRKEAERKKAQDIKDMQNISSGGPANFAH